MLTVLPRKEPTAMARPLSSISVSAVFYYLIYTAARMLLASFLAFTRNQEAGER
jgi:hypothetical protein